MDLDHQQNEIISNNNESEYNRLENRLMPLTDLKKSTPVNEEAEMEELMNGVENINKDEIDDNNQFLQA